MQNKTKTYILLAFVLGIWGIISYKIIAVVDPEMPELNKESFKVSFAPNKTVAIDTFSVQTTKRDPFLGTIYIKKKSAVKIIKKPETVWPTVLYHGSVTQQASKNKVFIVSVNKQQFLVKSGHTVSEITLEKGNNNQITVSYKGARKTINKL